MVGFFLVGFLLGVGATFFAQWVFNGLRIRKIRIAEADSERVKRIGQYQLYAV